MPICFIGSPQHARLPRQLRCPLTHVRSPPYPFHALTPCRWPCGDSALPGLWPWPKAAAPSPHGRWAHGSRSVVVRPLAVVHTAHGRGPLRRGSHSRRQRRGSNGLGAVKGSTACSPRYMAFMARREAAQGFVARRAAEFGEFRRAMPQVGESKRGEASFLHTEFGSRESLVQHATYRAGAAIVVPSAKHTYSIYISYILIS